MGEIRNHLNKEVDLQKGGNYKIFEISMGMKDFFVRDLALLMCKR